VTDDLLQSFARVDISDITLLGAPMFTGSVLGRSSEQTVLHCSPSSSHFFN